MNVNYEYMKGWQPLVEPLVEEVNRLGGRVLQVKEKFGGLRFYYFLPDVPRSEWDAMEKRVEEAENRSFVTCMNCGAPAKQLERRGWIVTLCDNCNK